MSDQELIRKAAAAIWDIWRSGFSARPNELYFNQPFSQLDPTVKALLQAEAEAALKVFLEHTRSQPRENVPPKCPDCSAVMNPTGASLVFFTCPKCGATR